MGHSPPYHTKSATRVLKTFPSEPTLHFKEHIMTRTQQCSMCSNVFKCVQMCDDVFKCNRWRRLCGNCSGSTHCAPAAQLLQDCCLTIAQEIDNNCTGIAQILHNQSANVDHQSQSLHLICNDCKNW